MPDLPRAIIFNRQQIQSAVDSVAESILVWLRSENLSEVTMISILEGAKPFASDLMALFKKRAPEISVEVHEVRVKGTEGTELLKNREWDGGFLDPVVVKRRTVLLVDDLVDSGKTLEMLRARVGAMGAGKIKTAVLFKKFGAESGPVDFCGFDLSLKREELSRTGLKDYWLFGYGMDLNGEFRELDHIGWVEIR